MEIERDLLIVRGPSSIYGDPRIFKSGCNYYGAGSVSSMGSLKKRWVLFPDAT